MDFLLECIGFPPSCNLADLARQARELGEPVAWRGPAGEHYRLPLGGGLDVRFDREEGARHWSLYPHYLTDKRLRMTVESVRDVPDSPFDVLVTGWANPPLDGPPEVCADSYPLSIVLTDRRRLPGVLEHGHVLAVSVSGFALDVEWVGPEEDRRRPVRGRPLPEGGWIAPLGDLDDPGGCVELRLQVKDVRRRVNPVTGSPVTRLETHLPGRPLYLFASPWQLQTDSLPMPEAGWFVEGTFLLTGRIAGGLPSPSVRVGRCFG